MGITLHQKKVTRVTHDNRDLIVKYTTLQAEVAEKQKELKRLQAEVLSLFEAEGVPFEHAGADKSECYAIAYQLNREVAFCVLRKGETQMVVDTEAYLTYMGETNESLKQKGFTKVRKGTMSITTPNKSQLKSLLKLFKE